MIYEEQSLGSLELICFGINELLVLVEMLSDQSVPLVGERLSVMINF